VAEAAPTAATLAIQHLFAALEAGCLRRLQQGSRAGVYFGVA